MTQYSTRILSHNFVLKLNIAICNSQFHKEKERTLPKFLRSSLERVIRRILI